MTEYTSDVIRILKGLEPAPKRLDERVFVENNDMSDVVKFREKIRAMDFIRLADEEVAEIARKHEKALINHRLSGMYSTNAEEAFSAMLLEERVPVHIRKEIVKEWAIASISKGES